MIITIVSLVKVTLAKSESWFGALNYRTQWPSCYIQYPESFKYTYATHT